MISRRRFLQATTAAGALMAFPYRAFPFSQSTTPILKFKVSVPLLVADGTPATTRGIPLLSPTTVNGTQVYDIVAGAFTQDLLGIASTLSHATKLWGYASKASAAKDEFQYLGGVIVATQNVPVQVNITNVLPAHHILPTDNSLIDPFSNQNGNRQDRIAIHLHGGLVFWADDGGPFLWFSNPDNGGFVFGPSFQNGPTEGTGVGTATYNYPNQQSARMLWYHDHAYGLTRTNVFAGLASAYLITDDDAVHGEKYLITQGIIPSGDGTAEGGLLGFPLIIQDKTFWDPDKGDMGYPTAVANPVEKIMAGDLWYPHVYESAPVELLPAMTLPPSEPPPFTPARWDKGPNTPATPTISSVPEYFSDTILVNGAPYPTLNVTPQRFRFRFLNASQGRFMNLQLYVADPTNPTDGITLAPIAAIDSTNPDNFDVNGNIILAPTNAAGPAFIQIANEAGFLPNPALFSNAVDGLTNLNSNLFMKWKNAADVRSHRRHADAGQDILFAGHLQQFTAAPGDPTIGNVNQHNLLLAPAERADVIIDFRGADWPAGTEFILYNDAPAPFPGGDTRNDYFVFPNPQDFGLPSNYTDLTPINGAPPTVQGQGPDTRILMKFILGGTSTAPDELSFADTVTTLQDTGKGLPFVFANTQLMPYPLPITGITAKVKALGEDYDEFGRLRQYLGNTNTDTLTFLDFPTEVALAGETQVWDIYNTTADTHPMHFHLVNVEVIGRKPWAFQSDGTPVLPLQPLDPTAPFTPPDANELGWRETVRMNPGEITRVAMRFDLPTGTAPANSKRLLASYGINGAEYVWHCHILEHEEHDMMHALVVITPPTK